MALYDKKAMLFTPKALLFLQILERIQPKVTTSVSLLTTSFYPFSPTDRLSAFYASAERKIINSPQLFVRLSKCWKGSWNNFTQKLCSFASHRAYPHVTCPYDYRKDQRPLPCDLASNTYEQTHFTTTFRVRPSAILIIIIPLCSIDVFLPLTV